MSKTYDPINHALGIEFVKQEQEEQLPQEVPKKKDIKEVTKEYKNLVKQTRESITENFSEDYEFIRETLKDLMVNGKDALEVATELAEQTESPRAYEVCTSIITTIAGLGKELVNLHKEAVKMADANEPEDKENSLVAGTVNVQNNYFSPSPKELQEIYNQVQEVEYDDSDLE